MCGVGIEAALVQPGEQRCQWGLVQGAVLGTGGVQQAPYGEGHGTVCFSWHPYSGQPLSTGDRLCRHGQTVCESAHALLVLLTFACSQSHLAGWWQSQ